MSDLHDDIVAIVYKHLQGKHDQKTHGRRGGVSMSNTENYKKWPRSHRVSQIKYLKEKLSRLKKDERPDYRKETERQIRDLEESLK